MRWSLGLDQKLIDDRGSSRAATDVQRLDVPAALRERLVRDMRESFGRSWSYVTVVGVAIFVVVLGIATFSASFPAMQMTYVFPVGMAMAIAIIHLNPWTRRRLNQMRQASTHTLKAALRCPACGYDLRSLVPAADGCTECSECGAAWRVDPGVQIDDERDLGTTVPTAAQFFVRVDALSVMDAAGRLVRLTFPIVALSPPRCWHGVEKDQRRRIQRRLWRVGLGARLLFLPFALAIAAIWLHAAFGRVPRPSSVTNLSGVGAMVWALVTAIMPLFCAALFLWFCIRPDIGQRERIRDIWLEEGRCPSCAARLDALGPPGSPSTRCATCGSTWAKGQRGTKDPSPGG